MIEDLRKVLALSALLSVLVAALFTFGAPVEAKDAQADDSVDAQNQENITSQAATTQGVPVLLSDDEDTDQTAASD
jgi:hypothetical protein